MAKNLSARETWFKKLKWEYPTTVVHGEKVIRLSPEAKETCDPTVWGSLGVKEFLVPRRFFELGVGMTDDEYVSGFFDRSGPFHGETLDNHLDGNSYEAANGKGGWFYLRFNAKRTKRVPGRGLLVRHVHCL